MKRNKKNFRITTNTCLYPELNKISPANEHLTMQIASQVYNIPTAANGLCFFQNDEPAYITRRFDIAPNGRKFRKEDFASLAGISKGNKGPNYKYDVLSYEEMADIIKQYVSASSVEVLKFFRLVIFNFLFSNGDAHAKNFSLLETPSGDFILAPAYDLLTTRLHIFDDHVFALQRGLFKENTLNGNDGAEAAWKKQQCRKWNRKKMKQKNLRIFRMKMNMRKNLSQNSLRTKREL